MTDLNELITKITDTIDDAGRLYGEHWDSALVGGEPNYHAVTSEHTQDVVVRAADDSRHSSWLCDYLEAVSPANVRQLLAYAGQKSETREAVADVVAWRKEGQERTCDIRWRRHDVEPGPLFTAPPATANEVRQNRDLVMMVKLLCRTVKKYNPTSQQAKDFIAYLEREGLISAADCLRDGAKDPE